MAEQENKNIDIGNIEKVNLNEMEVKEVVHKKKNKFLSGLLKAVMVIFFPITILVLFFKMISRKLKIPLTTKTTIIFTLMFAAAFTAFAMFIISSIESRLNHGDIGNPNLYIFNLKLTTIVLVIIFVSLVAALGGVASQAMLSPIRKMISKIDDVTSENLSTRLDEVDSQDELRELTNRINEMLDNLEQSFARQRNFVSDASHELKTPIAVIQGYSNLLIRWGKEKPEILDEAIDSIAREAENMKKIVEQLLMLARLGSFKMACSRFNLAEIINEVVESYKLVCKTHKISFSSIDNITVNTDKALIVESVRTLIDNAIKYTPADGVIKVKCSLNDCNAFISVADNGLGISQDDLEHIFDRFYRCDKARGRENGSSGLGLTIAKSIIEMMNGEITVESEVGYGSTFTVSLPAEENLQF